MGKAIKILVAIVAVFIVIGIATSGTESNDGPDVATGDTTEETSAPEESGPLSMSGNEEFPPADDVTLEGCQVNEHGWPTATVVITNHSPKASNYSIEVQFIDAEGVVIDTGYASASSLRPEQTAREEVGGLTDVEGGITCELNSVDRYSAEG